MHVYNVYWLYPYIITSLHLPKCPHPSYLSYSCPFRSFVVDYPLNPINTFHNHVGVWLSRGHIAKGEWSIASNSWNKIRVPEFTIQLGFSLQRFRAGNSSCTELMHTTAMVYKLAFHSFFSHVQASTSFFPLFHELWRIIVDGDALPWVGTQYYLYWHFDQWWDSVLTIQYSLEGKGFFNPSWKQHQPMGMKYIYLRYIKDFDGMII